MLLPIKWLKEYVEIRENTKILADNLTLSGSHVESIISLDRGIENVVVGEILELNKHENADKLFVTNIDIGNRTLKIVTGASNLKVGDYIPVALVGAKLPNGLTIEETDFRGIMSYGMLCSLKELGFSDNVIPKEQRDGIFILNEKYPLGTDINKVLGLYGDIIEFEITPNRSDCLSIIGMARETAATFNRKLKYPKIEIKNEIDSIDNYLDSVEIDEELCNRYYTKIIKNVEIKESPLWLQTRLMEAGMRPINNIVDITNYVMLEFGQPLHAFDLDKLNSKKIQVRKAEEGEKITTIDDVERTLKPSNLVIADENRPIAIAGVMGGFDTEVDENTTTILLESANFNSKSVRLTAKDLNLRTEASSRFEKGIDPNLCETAANRVCQLVEKIGAGTVIKNSIDSSITNTLSIGGFVILFSVIISKTTMIFSRSFSDTLFLFKAFFDSCFDVINMFQHFTSGLLGISIFYCGKDGFMLSNNLRALGWVSIKFLSIVSKSMMHEVGNCIHNT